MTTDFCPTCGAYWHCEHRAGAEDPALHQLQQSAAAVRQFTEAINAVAQQLVDVVVPQLQKLAQAWAWLLDLLQPAPAPVAPAWHQLPVHLLAPAWRAAAPEHPPWPRAPPAP